MAFSQVVLTGDGTTNQFAVNFALDYLQEADVTCRVGTEVDGSGFPFYRTITFLSTNLLQISGAPPGVGVSVLFERTVDKDTLLVDFSNGDQMDEDNLMIAQKQAIMAVHEVLDGRYSSDSTSAANAALALAQANVAVANRALTSVDAANALASANAAQAALTAFLASPHFTGIPTVPTAAPNTDTTQIASTSYVQSALNKNKATIYAGMLMEAYGDSITVGSASTDNAVTAYAPLFASANGLNLARYSVSGVGSVHQLGAAYVNMAQFNRTSLATWMAYHNDVYRGGSAAATVAKIEGALRGFLANCFLNLAYPANHPTQIVPVGTWTVGSGLREKAPTLNAGAGRLLYSSIQNNTISWTFTGDNVVVGLFNASVTPYQVGTASISVDGATSGNGFRTYDGNGKSDGITDGIYDNYITSVPVILTGLGPGAHTVTVKVTSATAKPLYVDYFGTLQPATAASPVIITEAPRPAVAGYTTLPGAWSDAAFNTVDAAVYAVVAEFTALKYPVSVAKVGTYLDRVAGISGDNEHPNNVGHAQLAAALQDVVTVQRATFVPTKATDLKRSAVQSISHAAYNQITWQTVISDDDGLFSASVPTRLTARRACTLEVKGFINFAVNATGVREIAVAKNGGTPKLLASQPSSGGDAMVLPFYDKLVLVNGDYIEINVIQSSGGALNLGTDSFLSATIVR